MMYLRWFLSAIISFVFNFVVYITSPIWALIAAVLKLTKLPGFLAWIHTHDDDIYGSKTTHEAIPATTVARFKRALWWIIRNPGYGFDAYVLGFRAEDVASIVKTPDVAFDTGLTVSQRWDITLKNGSKRFCYRRDQMLFGNRWCKIFIGWHWDPKDGLNHMLKIMVNPLRTF